MHFLLENLLKTKQHQTVHLNKFDYTFINNNIISIVACSQRLGLYFQIHSI